MLNLEERDGVAIIRLQHGKVNALDLELLLAITEAMHAVDQARAVVIPGSGSAFSAGVDLQRIVAGGPSYVREYLPALSGCFMAVFDHPGPVVAAEVLLDSAVDQARQMARIPADVFRVSKRQLQERLVTGSPHAAGTRRLSRGCGRRIAPGTESPGT
jgi:hypothetical protein